MFSCRKRNCCIFQIGRVDDGDDRDDVDGNGGGRDRRPRGQGALTNRAFLRLFVFSLLRAAIQSRAHSDPSGIPSLILVT